ncbi:hypothetical protein NW768_010237 [Fusarium equiseti]|uniref:Uncharacterized protein n=1 Tax=Fusarium equiseti TaxID=61235 RepID=A0ABQ8R1H2_FUSEQ|nr:hypothetical protein NW768_010237 [Fusarium equiseti]
MHCTNIFKLIGLVGLAVHVAAKPQQVAKRNHDYILPRVTAAPRGLLEEVELLQGHGVQARQVSSSSAITLTLTIAPDETCGYLSGSLGVPITCENKARCTWEQDSINVIACSMEFYRQCVESKTAVNPRLCNDRVEHTFKGDDSPGFITTTISDDVPTMPASDTVSESSETDVPTTTSDYPETTTSSEVPTSSRKPVPVGAIVGGVVGGLAVLGLIAIGTIIALRRRKPKPTVDTTVSYQTNTIHEPSQMTQKPQSGPPHQQVVHSPIYDPGMASSPAQPNPHTSMASGSVSPAGPASPTGWSQYPSPEPIASPAPAYEVAGPEAREAPSVHELDISTRK